jgi:hypothetical protein
LYNRFCFLTFLAFDKMNFMIFFRDKMKKVVVSQKVKVTVCSRLCS